jgi:hypothetical protein
MNYAILNNHGKEGFCFENLVESMATDYGIDVKRYDKTNLSNPDLQFDNNLLVDPKLKVEVFRKALIKTGIEPLKCVVIDVPKIKAYAKAQFQSKLPVLLLIKVDFELNNDKKINTYMITLNQILNLYMQNTQRIRVFQDYQKDKELKRFYISTDEMTETTLDNFFRDYKSGKLIELWRNKK